MYRPIENKLIIRKIEKAKTTASGIIIHESSEPADTAEVVAVGSNIDDIEVGNMIMFCPYAGTDLEDGLTQINYYDVLGVLL